MRAVTGIDPVLEVTRVEPLGDGVKSEVFRAHCSDGRELAVKLFKEQHRAAAAREAACLGALAGRADLPVPALIGQGDDWLALSVLPGEAMGSMLGWMDAGDQFGAYNQLGAFLGDLHRTKASRFGGLPGSGLPDFATNREFMTARFDWALARYREYGGRAELADAAEERVAERAELFEGCADPVVVHFDLHPQNVLLRRAEDRSLTLTGVVDWESAHAADPLTDIAQAWHMAPHRAPEHLEALVAGYGGIEAGWRQRLDLYVLYFSLELWIWFVKGGSPPPHEGIDERIAALSVN